MSALLRARPFSLERHQETVGATIADEEFAGFQRLIHDIAGIRLSSSKKPLLCGRLARRLRALGLRSYGQYLSLLAGDGGGQELQIALDLITTNETHFFREQKHFDFLRDHVLPWAKPGSLFRVWSAACSTGEEPYSVAMVLANCLGASWEVVASDISTRVLVRARTGHYPLERSKSIPSDYLRKYCLRGIGAQSGTFLVARELRQRVRFRQVNLNERLPELGRFDAIFLRNVMIYFDAGTKRAVVARLVPLLKPGGHFFVGHSETLNGVTDRLVMVRPSIYRKPGS